MTPPSGASDSFQTHCKHGRSVKFSCVECDKKEQHLVHCNYHGNPVGSPGCICRKESLQPCANCKEMVSECACMRNKCLKCGNPVGNITFTACDPCFENASLKKQLQERDAMIEKLQMRPWEEGELKWAEKNAEITALKIEVNVLKTRNESGDAAQESQLRLIDTLQKQIETQKLRISEGWEREKNYLEGLEALMSDKHNCACEGDGVLEPRFVCGGHALLEARGGE